MVQSQQTVLFVLTSTKTMGEGGKPTGAWLEEFTVPYYAIRDAGLLPISRRPKGAPCRSVEEVRVGTSPGKSAAILHLTTADNVPLAVEIPVAILGEVVEQLQDVLARVQGGSTGGKRLH